MGTKGIEPIFIRQRDLQSRDISAYTICQSMARIVGNTNVDGAQLINQMWRLYVKDKTSRVNLLSKKELLIVNRSVPLYDKNPQHVPEKEKLDKLTIRQVPLSVDNAEIKKMLEANDVQVMTEIKYVYERDEDGNITSFKNGDRFVFVKPFDPPIKRSQTVDGTPAIVIHHGKDNRPCRACSQTGHKIGSPKCPALPSERIYAFRGYRSPLSNHYPFELDIWDQRFGSIEHAFFYKMAMDMGMPHKATEIQNARHAGVAKALSHFMADEETRHAWERETGIPVMRELLYEKCRQCPDFVYCIYHNRECKFPEATSSAI